MADTEMSADTDTEISAETDTETDNFRSLIITQPNLTSYHRCKYLMNILPWINQDTFRT